MKERVCWNERHSTLENAPGGRRPLIWFKCVLLFIDASGAFLFPHLALLFTSPSLSFRAKTVTFSFEDGGKIAPSHTFLPPWCWVMGRLSTFLPLPTALNSSQHAWMTALTDPTCSRTSWSPDLLGGGGLFCCCPGNRCNTASELRNFLWQCGECGKGGDCHERSNKEIYLREAIIWKVTYKGRREKDISNADFIFNLWQMKLLKLKLLHVVRQLD